jgi:hypothetical protein
MPIEPGLPDPLPPIYFFCLVFPEIIWEVYANDFIPQIMHFSKQSQFRLMLRVL